jgi:ArsR family transcriptional regulator
MENLAEDQSQEIIDKMQQNCIFVSNTLKTLAHPQRLMILCFLAKQSRTVSELQELCKISQSGVSQFLARMKQEGLVEAKRDGSHVYYSIQSHQVLSLIQSLHQIYCEMDSALVSDVK